jgi:hypothetical protein
MRAYERAQRDEAAGDLGSARRRLLSVFASVGYSPELCERIARLCIRMGDPQEAGRWYFLCDSGDPEAGPAIERFRASCGGLPLQMVSQLPAKVRHAPRDQFPEVVRARLNPLGDFPRPPGPPREVSLLDELVQYGCPLAFTLLVISTVVGVVVIFRWVLSLLF